jgi:PTH2 family peptidyl-tRNA hydrolase
MSVKQVIVVRKDLNMRKGKLAAQVAHASMKVFFDMAEWTDHDRFEIFNIPEPMIKWMNYGDGSFTKIVVGVNSEEELLEIQKKAFEAKIPNALIKDNGLTEFHGMPTNTCIAIGPDEEEKIDAITGELKLL